MPKNNKKKNTNNVKDPYKLKVILIFIIIFLNNFSKQDLGNKAFENKNYEEAIDFYTKAIDEKNDEPVFYSNSKFLKKFSNIFIGANVFMVLE